MVWIILPCPKFVYILIDLLSVGGNEHLFVAVEIGGSDLKRWEMT